MNKFSGFRQTSLVVYLNDVTGEMMLLNTNAVHSPHEKLYLTKEESTECLNKLNAFHSVLTDDEIQKAESSYREPEKESQKRNGYIYLMESKGEYKIGYTRQPIGRRVSQIRQSIKSPVAVIKTWLVDDPEAVEEMLHETFREQNIKGEWFNLTGKHFDLLDSVIFGVSNNG